jgi:hypothetical protein
MAQPKHELHARSLEVGGVKLSWFALEEFSQEFAETIAIRVLRSAWNSRKNALGHLDDLNPPSRYSDDFLKFEQYSEINLGDG